MEDTYLVLHEVLPVEVILHVFSYLPPKGVLQAEAVCREWREIANSEWLWELVQKKTFGQGPNVVVVKARTRSFPGARDAFVMPELGNV